MGKILFNDCAVSRIQNHFCLPYLHSEGSFRDIDGFFRVVPDRHSHILGMGSYLKVYEKSLGRKFRRGKRSEEHTSELQSRFELVCRLLLEKKNSRTRQVRTSSIQGLQGNIAGE